MANLFSQLFSQFGPAPAQRMDQGGGEYTGRIPGVYEGDDTYIPELRAMATPNPIRAADDGMTVRREQTKWRDAQAEAQRRVLARMQQERLQSQPDSNIAIPRTPQHVSVLNETFDDTATKTPSTIADAAVASGSPAPDVAGGPNWTGFLKEAATPGTDTRNDLVAAIEQKAKLAGGVIPTEVWDLYFKHGETFGNWMYNQLDKPGALNIFSDKNLANQAYLQFMSPGGLGEKAGNLWETFNLGLGDKIDELFPHKTSAQTETTTDIIKPPVASDNPYILTQGLNQLMDDEAAVRAGRSSPWTPQDFQPDQGRNTSGAPLTRSQLAEIVKDYTWANPTADEEGIGGGGAGAPVGPGLYPGSSEAEIPAAAEPVVVETGTSQNNIDETGGDEGTMVSALKGTGEVVKDNWKVLTAAGLAAEVARRRHNTVKVPTPLAKLKAQLKAAPDGPGRKQILREMKDLRKQRWAKLIPKWVTKPRVMAAAGVILIGAAAFEKAFASEDTKGDLEDYIVDALEKDNNLLSTALQMTDPISMMAGGTGLSKGSYSPGGNEILRREDGSIIDFRDEDSPYHESKRPPLHRPGSAGEALTSMMTPENVVGPSGIADYWKNKIGSLF